MEYAPLGGSGLSVSRLGFGAATFGAPDRNMGIGSVHGDEAKRLVDACLDRGITLFDTADSYAEGASEEILGAALGMRRQEVVLATKTGLPRGPGPGEIGLSRQSIVAACEASLRRLGTDWIDLYQMHVPDMLTPAEETLRAMDDLVRAGKVRHIGCSNFAAWYLMKNLAISAAEGLAPIVSQQIYYSLVDRSCEQELVPASIDKNLGILVWGPLASGFLSGKVQRGDKPVAGTRLGTTSVPKVPEWEHAHDVLDLVRSIAADRGASPGQVAINWLRTKPWVTSVLIGARNQAQLDDNLGAASWTLGREEMLALDGVSRTPLPYPYWVHRQQAGERNPELSA